MPLIKTQKNISVLEASKRVYPIINKLNNGDIFYLPPNHKIIANKDSDRPEIIDGDCELVYEQDGKIKNLYIVNLTEMQQRCVVSKKIDDYLVYCAMYLTWKGVDPIKFFDIPEEIATDDGLYDYVNEIIDKSVYESFRPEATQDEFKNLVTKKANKYFEEYGISIDGDVYLDGYMCEKEEKEEEIIEKKDDNDDDLFLDVNSEEELEPVPKIKYESEPESEKKEEKVIIQTIIKCKNCGYIPEGRVPKFCPECGTKFDI